jgi:hypothetical protein
MPAASIGSDNQRRLSLPLEKNILAEVTITTKPVNISAIAVWLHDMGLYPWYSHTGRTYLGTSTSISPVRKKISPNIQLIISVR